MEKHRTLLQPGLVILDLPDLPRAIQKAAPQAVLASASGPKIGFKMTKLGTPHEKS